MIRKAVLGDCHRISEMVNHWARQEVMLPLSMGEIMERLRDFHVYEAVPGDPRSITGCAAVHITWHTLVELRSLAVDPDRQGGGVGSALIRACIEEANLLGAREIFTLTYIPRYFERFGFTIVDRATLPHKVWRDCFKCSKAKDCAEIAMKLVLQAKPKRAPVALAQVKHPTTFDTLASSGQVQSVVS